jgi:LysR substrate binding domain
MAIIFRYDDAENEPAGIRLHYLLDDPMYLLANRRTRGLASLSKATWVAGCERCRGHLLALCQTAGFEPRIGYESDDMVLIQALVAAGLCVATLPGLAVRAPTRRWHHRYQTPRSAATRLRRDLRRPARPTGRRRATRCPRRGGGGGLSPSVLLGRPLPEPQACSVQQRAHQDQQRQRQGGVFHTVAAFEACDDPRVPISVLTSGRDQRDLEPLIRPSAALGEFLR